MTNLRRRGRHPTPYPEAGQGPWCDMNSGRWWVIADNAADAMRELHACDADPGYFGVTLTLERVAIRWVPIDQWDEEHEVEETRYASDEGAVEAWRLTVAGV